MTGRKVVINENTDLPSAEKPFGWFSQYERMLRWRQRARDDPSLDVLLAFFLNIYALRDWIIKDIDIKAKDIESHIENYIEMKICKDICNRSKHYTITRPGFDKNFSIAREYVGKHAPDKIIILTNGTTFDLREVAEKCIFFWDSFLRSRGLLKGEATTPPDGA